MPALDHPDQTKSSIEPFVVDKVVPHRAAGALVEKHDDLTGSPVFIVHIEKANAGVHLAV